MSNVISRLFHRKKRKPVIPPPRPDELMDVPLEWCISSFGVLFAPPGWHPFTQDILERLEDPDRPPEQSALAAWYAHVQPHDDDFFPCLKTPNYRYRPSLIFMPWGTGYPASAANERMHQFGPKPVEFVREKRDYLMHIFRRLQRDGYEPERYRDEYVRGCLLIGRGGEKRYIINGGQHRVAALAALGVKSVRARFQHGWPREVRETEAASWPSVVKGKASVEEAVAFFRSYFDLPPDFRKPPALPTRAPWRYSGKVEKEPMT